MATSPAIDSVTRQLRGPVIPTPAAVPTSAPIQSMADSLRNPPRPIAGEMLRQNIPTAMQPGQYAASRVGPPKPVGIPNGATQTSAAGVQGRVAGAAAAPGGVGNPGGVPGGVGSNPAAQVKPTLRGGVAAQPRALGKAAYGVGRGASFVAGAIPAAVGGAVVSQMGDYQIDDPGVDSSAAGTFNSLRAGDFSGAGRGLSKGALEAGMDLGGSVAKGVDLLTFGKAGAEQGYNNFLRGQFGDQIRIGGVGGAPTTPISGPPGMPSMPGAGRDAKAKMGDFSRPATDRPGYDFTNDLNKVPAQLPSGLREGAIYATGNRGDGRPNVFSGINVKEGADYVNGRGESIRGGNFNTVPGMSKEQIAEVMARPSAFNPNSGLTGAQQAQYQREVENAQRINAFTAAQGRISSLRQQQQQKPVDVSRLPGESRAAYATRVNAMVGMRGQDFDETQDVRRDGTSRRGQDLNYDSTLRGQGVQMRGQDMDLQGRILPKQMEMQYNAQMRAARAQIFQQAGGDPAKAAQIAQSYGMDGKDFLDAATTSESLGAARVKSGRAAVENMSVTQDKDGNPVVNEAMVAQNANVANQLTEGRWNSMSAAERAAATPRVQAGTNLFQGMNARRDNGFLQAIGIDDPSPAYDKLPDMRGAKEGTVGYLEGMTTFGGVSKGDRKVTLRDGTTRYIPNNKVSDAERQLMRELGVQLKGD